jgi:hypothetical protein
VKAEVCLVTGVNRDTVWTWNAIGKRAGAWGLDAHAPEVRKGFLLNHLISELLPARADGYRYSNADPVTGQAAWFDLRVNIEKCGAHELAESSPQFAELSGGPAHPRARVSRFGHDLKSNAALPDRGEHREFVGNRHEVTAALSRPPRRDDEGHRS